MAKENIWEEKFLLMKSQIKFLAQAFLGQKIIYVKNLFLVKNCFRTKKIKNRIDYGQFITNYPQSYLIMPQKNYLAYLVAHFHVKFQLN